MDDVLVHWNLIEADYLRYYHLDLAEALRGDNLSWRRFSALLAGLPHDSAFATAVRLAAERAEVVIEDAEAAEREVGKLFGG